jgi:hypothetical protein
MLSALPLIYLLSNAIIWKLYVIMKYFSLVKLQSCFLQSRIGCEVELQSRIKWFLVSQYWVGHILSHTSWNHLIENCYFGMSLNMPRIIKTVRNLQFWCHSTIFILTYTIFKVVMSTINNAESLFVCV